MQLLKNKTNDKGMMYAIQPNFPNGTKKKLRGGRRPKRPRKKKGTTQRGTGTPQQEQEQEQEHTPLLQKTTVDEGNSTSRQRDGTGTGTGTGTSLTIWRTLDEAKRKQNSIRKRVRKYGRNDDDSDYSDSPSSDNNNDNRNGGDCDSYDDDDFFDLKRHQDDMDMDMDMQKRMKAPLEPYPPLPQTGSPKTTKSSPATTAVRTTTTTTTTTTTSSDTFENIARNEKKTSNEHQNKQMLSTKKGQIRRVPTKTTKYGRSPALTPEEAIRMVMEQHLYISDDSEKSAHKVLIKKSYKQKSSSSVSTAETVANTTASHMDEDQRENSRIHKEKRVLLLKKKKAREDTHPVTSKNKQYHDKQPWHQQKQHRTIQGPPRVSTNNRQHSQPQQEVQSLVPPRHAEVAVQEIEQNVPKEEEERNEQGIQLDRHQDDANDTTDHESDGEKEGPSNRCVAEATDPHPTLVADKHSQEQQQQRALIFEAMAEREEIVGNNNERAIDRDNDVDDNDNNNNDVDDNDVDDNDDNNNDDNNNDDNNNDDNDGEDESRVDLLGPGDSVVKQQNSNASGTDVELTYAVTEGYESNLQGEKCKIDGHCNDGNDDGDTDYGGGGEEEEEDDDERSIEPTQEDGREEDWGQCSFATAKTSKSVVSRYSKTSSSTSLWMKIVEQDHTGNDKDDDILFFDAIQDVGESNHDKSMEPSKSPPKVITEHGNKIEQEEGPEVGSGDDDGSDGEGWTEKITNFVGYTIGALTSGSKDEDEEEADLPNTEPVSQQPLTETASTDRTEAESESPQKSPRRSHPDASNTVPSRELEIIRKCQEQMKHTAKYSELRERGTARQSREDMELRRREEEDRAVIRREVIAYRRMMEGMGKGEKLAPRNSREAAKDYDDRLALVKTLKEHERKVKMNELNLIKMEMQDRAIYGDQSEGCACACIIS